ncbi:cytochrome p450 [Rhizoctonia solani]|uniref:Cytochrome p450 n=1 Tax=Rhizoctonia solani TaxID=456999 RepID=A0A8H7IP81_9AGAM|nr:cytochrome p450 [Rhizoctonia solani]
MSNSTLVLIAPLQALLDTIFPSGGEQSTLDFLAFAKTHSLELALGALTVLIAPRIYAILRGANKFSELDGPRPASFIWASQPIWFHVQNERGFGEDQLWIADPRAMNDVILKGTDYFHEPDGLISWFKLAFGPNILTAKGHKHKIQRKASRAPTPVFHNIAHYLQDIVASRVRDNGNNTGIIDIYKWMNNVALEMIGQAGVGHSFGVMEDKEIQYLDASHQVLPLINSMWYIRPFLPTLTRLGPPGFRRFILDHVSFGPAQQLKKAADVMDKMANEIYVKKKESLANGTLDSEIAAGNDIISMLFVSPEEQMTEEEIISQVNGLVFAGHDTTSGALARTLHLLAQEPNVQEQLRAEIREAHSLYGKDLDYDQLNSLKYLDAVCRESLRLWSPSQTLERVA